MEESVLLKNLRNKGFAVEEGLHYCANSEVIYTGVLMSAAQEGKEKIPLLQECLKTKDIKRYQIEVHGLKNVSMTIGASQLFEQASRQNELAKEFNLEGLCAGQDDLLRIYRETIDIIDDVLPN